MGFSKAFVASVSVLATVQAAIPPKFRPDAEMELMVSFDNKMIMPGEQLGIDIPAQEPKIGLNTREGHTDPHLVVMVDPDAPTPDNSTGDGMQILHWMQTDLMISEQQSTSGDIPYTFSSRNGSVASYRRPMPPTTSAQHRYIQYLYGQPDNFTIPEEFNKISSSNRTGFNMEKFARAAGLGRPIAANFVLVANNTMLAPTATAAPSGPNGMPPPPPPTGSPKTGAASTLGSASGLSVLALVAAAVFASVM